jgi:hypothetical protein
MNTKSPGFPLPCGYIMGVQEALVTGIPGLKSEAWGTLRVSRAESIWGAVGWDSASFFTQPP